MSMNMNKPLLGAPLRAGLSALFAALLFATTALAQTPVPLGPSGNGGGGSGTMGSVNIIAGTNVTESGTCNSTTAISCTLNASGGGSPGGTVGQIQFNSAGSFGGFTMSGDCALVTSTGVITCAALGGKAVTLGAALTTTGASTPTLAFPASGTPTYTFPAASATLGTASGPGSSINGDLASFNGTGGQTLADSGIAAANVPVNTTNQILFAPLDKVGSAAVFGAGATYTTGDTITVATTGGTCSQAPVLTVTATSGAITALAVTTPGSCTKIPTGGPFTQGSTSGSGTGGTFQLTWAPIPQTYTPTPGMKLALVCALGPGSGGG